VGSYHALNLTIQLLAGLTLFGLVRRTLMRPLLRDRYGADALLLAWVIALLWMVHPLQTESVTYISQRAESLMGLFYLLTLYCFVRGAESSRAWAWHTLSATACLLGMFTKETMATAPLLLLLYDRTFIAGTFAGAWRQRWKFYAAVGCTWVPLAWIVASVSWPANASLRNPGLDGISPVMKSFDYGLKQCDAVVQYLSLSFWPHPLILHYGNDVVANPLDVAAPMALLALLLAGTIYALWRQPALGFLGAWFFVILAPTSSVVPLHGQTMAEHHLYLSLAAVLALTILVLHAVLGPRIVVAGLVLALALGSLTFERNRDYLTDVSIWTDTVRKRPDNVATHKNLSLALLQAGRLREALASYETIVRMFPGNSVAENDLGSAFYTLGQPTEAVSHYLQALKIDPSVAQYYYNLGNAYHAIGQMEKARDALATAVRIDPSYAMAHNNLAYLYQDNFGEVDQAITEFEAALRADSHLPKAHVSLADLYLKTNRAAEALAHYSAAIQMDPNFGEAHLGLGNALLLTNRAGEAVAPYETALRLMPGSANAHNDFANALIQLKRFDDAAHEFEEILRLDPNYPNARDNLDKIRQFTRQQQSNGPKP